MRPNSVRAILTGPPLTLSDVIRGGYFSHVATLIQMGIDVNGRDAEWKTPIMLCALIEDEDWGVGIARTLIENGAKLNLTDKFGLSALHLAVIYEREKLIKVFLSAADFDPNLTDKLGNTALHYAAMSGNMDITAVLVQYWNKYSLDGSIRNRRGRTPLQEAYAASQYGCASQLNKLTTSSSQNDAISAKRDSRRPKTAIPRIHQSTSTTSTVSTDISDQSVFVDQPRSSRRDTLHSASYSERPRSSRHSNEHNALYLTRPRSSRHLTPHSAMYSNRPSSSRPRILPNEKNSELVIRSASRKDFRNKREYIFKLTSIAYDDSDLCEKSLRSARARSCGPPMTRYTEAPSWRGELKRLFHEYEFQCSASYRQAARHAADHVTVVAPTDDDEADDRDRKRLCRRTSVMSRASTFSERDKRRSASRQRKVSVLPPGVHSKPSDVTEAKTSSSESSSVTQSWKKKETGLCKEVSRIQIHASDSASDPHSKGDNSSIPAVKETLVADDVLPEADVTETGCDVDNSRLFVTNQVDN